MILRKSILLFLILFSSIIYSQNLDAVLKKQALSHMKNGRYGEAIDLLNKYVSNNAQLAEGYNLRGFCYEKRGEYQNAVFNYRHANKLEPENKEIKANLYRATSDWHVILEKKIEGHHREIAINPKNPVNYLEIGKCYRWLEKFELAEEWYDRYLELDDNASPDEIIRYVEILAKTRSILKGEKILKKYTDRYPGDWRLWSRYGYFTYWLGKNKVAEKAFRTALSFKPFFEEAEDGLDLAINEPYVLQDIGRRWEDREYIIDRYFRILKKNPENDNIRFSLIEELMKVQRYEEASQQLLILKPKYEGQERFDVIYTELKSIRQDLFYNQFEKFTAILMQNPTDREAVIHLANAYADAEYYSQADTVLTNYLFFYPYDDEIKLLRSNFAAREKNTEKFVSILSEIINSNPNNKEAVDILASYYASEFEYDSSIVIINKYFEIKNEDQDLDLRVDLGKYYAWNYQWEDARDQIDIVLKYDPNNLDGQLLYGQITSWTVDENEFPIAEKYFNNVLENDGQNISALLGMATMRAWTRNLDDAKMYIDLAKKYHGTNPEIESTENFYNSQVAITEELKNLEIKKEAARLVQQGECDDAIDKYKEYMEAVKNPDRLTYIELAGTYVCAKKYDDAIELYTTLLNDNYEFDLALQRAKCYLWNDNPDSAIVELNKLVQDQPDDYWTNVFLADAYMMKNEYRDAENIYDKILETSEDTEQKEFLKKKIEYIPPYGLSGKFRSAVNYLIPYNLSVTPNANFYKDNQNLQYNDYGLRLETGFARYFSFSVAYKNTTLYNLIASPKYSYDNLESIIFGLYFIPTANFNIGAGMGNMRMNAKGKKNIGFVNVNFNKNNLYGASIYYEDDDLRRILQSPNLIGVNLNAYRYNSSIFYNYKKYLRLDLFYSYFKISDSNRGNSLVFKFSKYFKNNVTAGYEFNFSDFGFIATSYYSPQNFTVHSLWAEWQAYSDNKTNLIFGGKVGYAPSVDFIISDVYGDLNYKILNNLNFRLRLNVGNSFRFDSSYRYFSARAYIVWNFF
ncbi:MAG: hypothetical protein CO129_02285 [Ignavibacteriales bacterium CG_4_9_14_3_um_filter_34_10]|nr:MAG: hypothetical protein CO129_02285 [Ignavibacteriales bacterium CG_4_9_14_3_um_filter_34_10]